MYGCSAWMHVCVSHILIAAYGGHNRAQRAFAAET